MQLNQTSRPYNRMRYETVGDYLYHLDSDVFWFMIAEMGNTDYEALVFLHEFVEAYLCWKAQIPEEKIATFDREFEDSTKSGEPGDDPKAPYFKQHQIATKFERMLADELGVQWDEYDKAINDLMKEK